MADGSNAVPTAAKAGAEVNFKEVQKSYDGEMLVVKNLNLDIAAGEFLTMLGPSGSGKTTCLMMLAGFEPATFGEIYIDGAPINRKPPHKRGIGMVFQNYALFPHMTVGENLAFPLKVRHMSRADIEAKVKRALDMVELPQMANRMPGQLSGGQQQRIAVARALVFEPKLVLMDEPLGALDKNLREQMQYEIKHIHDRLGVTIVYVTHDQTEALTMSDRIAVFNDGVIQQLAPPAELYERPESAFVAAFIGENNRLAGTVKAIEGDYVQVELGNGQVVKALKVNVSSVGEKTTLSMRPERARFEDVENPAYDTAIDGTVKELIYLGDHIRIIADVPGTPEFVIRIANRDTQRFPSPGETIKIAWRSEDLRALDYDPSAA